MFKCRICGHNDYEGVFDTSNAIIGSTVRASHYFCTGCGVLFKDPGKFSVGKTEDEKQKK